MRRMVITGLILLGGLTSCHQPATSARVCTDILALPRLSVSRTEVRVGEPVTLTVTVPGPETCGGYETSRVAFYVNDQGYEVRYGQQATPLIFQVEWTPKAEELSPPGPGSDVTDVPVYARAETSAGLLWAYPEGTRADGPWNVIWVRVHRS